jgi:hypothetical protein
MTMINQYPIGSRVLNPASDYIIALVTGQLCDLPYNTLVESVAAAIGITFPVPVTSGGTGLGTLTANAVLLGNGTGNIAFASPGTAGLPLVSNGATSNPSFQALPASGGGTGVTTFTAHNVLLGEGTSVGFAAPSTAGQALVSNGATSDPSFQTIGVAGGGTGLGTLTAHDVLIGNGTSAVALVAPGASGTIFSSTGAANPAFQTKATLTIASSGVNGDITSTTALTTIDGPGTGAATLSISDTSSSNGSLIELLGNGATTPNKYIQAGSGTFFIRNNALTAIMDITDAGIMGLQGGTVPMCVPTIASLRAVLKTWTPYVYVQGYYTAGDLGGGWYFYVASDTSSADNGGTIIVATDGGRWYLQLQTPFVTSKQFGCYADGVHDDTAALQSAFNNTGHLMLSSGNHLITNVVTKVSCSNFILEGYGIQSTIECDNATAHILYFGDGTNQYVNVTLKNFGIWSAVTKTAGAAIVMLVCARSIIDHVEMSPPELVGAPNLFYGLYCQDFDDMKVMACHFLCSNVGVLIFGGSFGDDFYLGEGTRINCSTTSSIGLWISGGCGGVTIDDCDIIGCENNVVIDQANLATANRELFFGPGCAIDSAGFANFWIKANGCTTCVMSGTWCSSSGQSTASGTGIQVDSPQSTAGLVLQCTNMKIFNNAGGGVTINGGGIIMTGCYINANAVSGAGGQGVLLNNSGIAFATFVGNTIIGNGISTNGVGLLIEAGVSNTNIQCNTVRANAQLQIDDASGAVNKLIQNNLTT